MAGNSKIVEPLPLIRKRNGELQQFSGELQGGSIAISDLNDIESLNKMGCFGKGNFSRSYPQKNIIIRERTFEIRRKLGNTNRNAEKVVVVPNSDSEGEYLKDLTPRYQFDYSGMKEILYLGLEEAYFLFSALKCLTIKYQEDYPDVSSIWKLFQETDGYFIQNYIIYYYFRSRNWVVKPGIKFGGEFLLYKEGPAFNHAAYLVLIQVIDDNLNPIRELNRRLMSSHKLIGLHRLAETAGKELLIADIIWPSTLRNAEIGPEDLSKFSVKITKTNRWVG